MSRSSLTRSTETLEILLVEANPDEARLTQEASKKTDCEMILHVVTTGEGALKFVTQQDAYESASLPDLVLLNLKLPGKDGCDVLKAIRDDPQLRSLSVIIFASSGASEDIASCYNAHSNAYLTKPTGLAKFTRLVKVVEQFWFKRVQFPPHPQ